MKKEKIKNLINWYILGYYHCDECPYSWEERGLEDADAGCWLFGELRETCRVVRNPIAKMIVNKHINENSDQWDCWYDYGDKYEIAESIYTYLKVQKQHNPIIDEAEDVDCIDLIFDIIEKYDALINPYKKPWEKLKESFKEWNKDFWYKNFKIYFARGKR